MKTLQNLKRFVLISILMLPLFLQGCGKKAKKNKAFEVTYTSEKAEIGKRVPITISISGKKFRKKGVLNVSISSLGEQGDLSKDTILFEVQNGNDEKIVYYTPKEVGTHSVMLRATGCEKKFTEDVTIEVAEKETSAGFSLSCVEKGILPGEELKLTTVLEERDSKRIHLSVEVEEEGGTVKNQKTINNLHEHVFTATKPGIYKVNVECQDLGNAENRKTETIEIEVKEADYKIDNIFIERSTNRVYFDIIYGGQDTKQAFILEDYDFEGCKGKVTINSKKTGNGLTPKLKIGTNILNVELTTVDPTYKAVEKEKEEKSSKKAKKELGFLTLKISDKYGTREESEKINLLHICEDFLAKEDIKNKKKKAKDFLELKSKIEGVSSSLLRLKKSYFKNDKVDSSDPQSVLEKIQKEKETLESLTDEKEKMLESHPYLRLSSSKEIEEFETIVEDSTMLGSSLENSIHISPRGLLNVSLENGELNTAFSIINELDSDTLSNMRFSEGKTILHVASESNDAGILESAINAISNIDIRDGNNSTPFELAIRGGKETSVGLLLRGGADIKQRTLVNNDSMLHLGCYGGNQAIIDQLLNYRIPEERRNRTAGQPNDRINPNLMNNERETPLSICYDRNNIGGMRSLIRSGANLNQYRDEDGKTLLNKACSDGNIEVARLLIRSGADQTIQCNARKTPFMSAFSSNQSAILQLLGPTNQTRAYSELERACRTSRTEKFNMLLDHCFIENRELILSRLFSRAIELKNMRMLNTILQTQVNVPDHPEILSKCIDKNWLEGLQTLLNNEATQEVTNESGESPLEEAIRSDLPELAHALSEKQNYQEGLRLLESAYLSGDKEKLKFLLANCINRRQKEVKSLELLNRSFEAGDTEKMKIFLEMGTNPDECMNANNETLLFQACANTNKDLVELLLKFEANPLLPNLNNITPIKKLLRIGNDRAKETLEKINTSKCYTEYFKVLFDEYFRSQDQEKLKFILKTKSLLPKDLENEGASYLESAFQEENQDIFDILLKAKLNANIPDSNGQTLLDRAYDQNSIEKIYILIKHADIDTKLLFTSLRDGRIEIFKKFVLELKDNEVAKEGALKDNLLLTVCETRNMDLINYLINTWAIDLSRKDSEGKDILKKLYDASNVRVEYYRVMERLMLINENGVTSINPDGWKNSNGETLLHVACKEGKDKAVKALVKGGADQRLKTRQNKKPLDFVADQNDDELSVRLLNALIGLNEHGRQPTDIREIVGLNEEYDGKNELYTSVSKSKKEFSKKLLEFGVRMTNNSNDTNSAIYKAFEGNDDFFKYFIREISNLNMRGEDRIFWKNNAGKSLLHLAIENSWTEKASSLIEHGANLTHRDNRNQTPLKRIIKNQNQILAEAIRDNNLIKEELVNILEFYARKTTLRREEEEDVEFILQHCITNTAREGGQRLDLKPILWRSQRSSNHKMMELLIAHGVSPQCHKNRRDGLTNLHWACYKKDLESMKKLLGSETVPNFRNLKMTDTKGYTPVHYSAMEGDENMLKLFVEKNINIDIRDREGHTPLYIALDAKKEATMKLLIENGANPIIYRNGLNGDTNFHEACRNGEKKMVEILLSGLLTRGQVLNETNDFGQTGMYYAIKNGHKDIVEELVESLTPVQKKTAFHYAQKFKKYNIIKFLVDKGIGPVLLYTTNTTGITNLHFICRRGDIKLLDALLSNTNNLPDIESLKEGNSRGYTPLHYAAEYGHTKIIKKLKEKFPNLNLNIKDNQRQTPLNRALKNSKYDTVSYLVENGANRITYRRSDGRTNLHDYCESGNYDAVKALLSGTSSETKSFLSKTEGLDLIHYAIKKGHLSIVKLLDSKGSPINEKDAYGKTPLSYAFDSGNIAMIEHFLSGGQKYNAKGIDPDEWRLKGEDRTFLGEACRKGQKKVVKKLLKYGANPSHKDIYGKTPLWYACENGDIAIMELLLSTGQKENKNRVDSGSTKKILNPDSWRMKETRRTLLGEACRKGQIKVVEKLLEYGANPLQKETTTDGYTPVHQATLGGHIEVLKLIYEKGLYEDLRSKKKKKPILNIFNEEDEEDNEDEEEERYSKYLSIKTKKKLSPILLALRERNIEMIEFLVKHMANPDDWFKGKTALHYILDLNSKIRYEYLDALCSNKSNLPDLDAWRESDSYTPLHIATEKRSFKLIDYLIEKGADIDWGTEHDHRSGPVWIAYGKKDIKLLNHFRDKGADMDGIETALMYEDLTSILSTYCPGDMDD